MVYGYGTHIYDNCYFINNTATNNAGAIFLERENQHIENASFEGNTAKNGGAIKIQGGDIKIDNNCIFFNNTAYENGGAIKIDGNRANIDDNCRFINNTAIWLWYSYL